MPHDEDEDEQLDLTGTSAAGLPPPRAFTPAQLLTCPTCNRANGPVRMNCLYCGAALPAAAGPADLRRPVLRALESWEQGYNVVLLPRPTPAPDLAPEARAAAAQVLRCTPAQLQAALTAHALLPLARTVEQREAALIEQKLAPLGLPVEVVADAALAVETHPPQRLHRLAFEPAGLTGWANLDPTGRVAAWPEILLLVVGRILRRRIEVEERRGRRRGEGEPVDTREFAADEAVLDIYTHEPARNWRILADGFDYSCLGPQKGWLTGENFTRLLTALRAHAPNAVYAADYGALRHLLQAAWPVAEQSGTGLRRERPGRFNVEAVTEVSNEIQFTRYGRLRQHFLLRPRGQQ